MEAGKKAILPSLRRQIGSMHLLRDLLPQKSRLQLMNSQIIGKLVYLIPLWGSTTENYVKKAQIVLNRAARYVTRASRRTRTSELMAQCNWLWIKELILYHSLIHLWKILKCKTPITLYKEFVITDDWMISTAAPRLLMTAGCFKWKMITVWNALPEFIRMEMKLSVFKKQVKTRIIEMRVQNDANRRRPPDPD